MSDRPPNPAAALRAFIACEEREHLFERQLLGVAFWQLIRHDVFRETLEALGLIARGHLRLEELPVSRWLGPQLRQLPSTLLRSHFAGLAPAELLVATHPRHLLHRGRYICPYTQPLLWGTQRSRVLLTGQFQGRYFPPDVHERTRYVDLGLVLAHARFRARELAGRGFGTRERSQLAGVREALIAQLGAAPPLASLERRARTAVLSSLGMSGRFDRMLERVRPRVLVNVIGYRLVHQILTVRARDAGIPVAEVQHGTIGAAHAAYNFAHGRRPPAFPDHLLTFGELWRELTPGLPLPAANVHAVGYGWLELQRHAYPRRASASGRRRVLFLSQRDIGAQLSQLAAALHARCGAELELCYRLHPSEAHGWQAAYPELHASGVRVEEATSRPLYAAQADADVQVGVYSTALLEGMAFGLQTVIVQLPGSEQLSFLVERGLAQSARDADELVAATYCASRPAADGGERLWAPDPPTRFASFVEGFFR